MQIKLQAFLKLLKFRISNTPSAQTQDSCQGSALRSTQVASLFPNSTILRVGQLPPSPTQVTVPDRQSRLQTLSSSTTRKVARPCVGQAAQTTRGQ